MSAGWRSRRTSKPSWRSTCPAPRWWWATARREPRWSAKYPAAKFLGPLTGEALVRGLCRRATCSSFPSRTDTFGLVLLEALACGVPVAAYPVPGPLDVVGDAPALACWTKICAACLPRWHCPPSRAQSCRALPSTRSWRACTLQFLANLPLEADPVPAAAAVIGSRPPDRFALHVSPFSQFLRGSRLAPWELAFLALVILVWRALCDRAGQGHQLGFPQLSLVHALRLPAMTAWASTSRWRTRRVLQSAFSTFPSICWATHTRPGSRRRARAIRAPMWCRFISWRAPCCACRIAKSLQACWRCSASAGSLTLAEFRHHLLRQRAERVHPRRPRNLILNRETLRDGPLSKALLVSGLAGLRSPAAPSA